MIAWRQIRTVAISRISRLDRFSHFFSTRNGKSQQKEKKKKKRSSRSCHVHKTKRLALAFSYIPPRNTIHSVFVPAASRSRRQLRIKENCFNYGMPFANSRACTLIAMLCSSFLREYGNGGERDLSRIYVHVLCAFTRSTWPLLIRAATSNPPILILSTHLTSVYTVYTHTHTHFYILRMYT